jgi:photosystem II stability/assembly factor-like uncharacterized protein
MKTLIVLAVVMAILTLSAPAAGAPGLLSDSAPADPPAGRWQCWTPPGAVPCGYTLSVAGVSATDAWGVSSNGLIMRWDGEAWREAAGPAGVSFTTVTMLSADDGWAVGSAIARWDGVAWRLVDSPAGGWLNAVTMLSAGDGWAVGSAGVIMRWDGVAWRLVDSPTQQSLYSVSAAGPNDVWAVGAEGAMLHWDGMRWIEFSATPHHLRSVQMLSPSDGWAVGHRGTILRWDGSDWLPVASPTTDDLYSLSMAGEDAGWAVGGAFHETNSTCGTGYYTSVLLRWDGVAWTQAAYPVSSRLFTISMISADSGWAAGQDGAILYWNGSGWNATTPYVDRSWTLDDIAMVSPSDGWAVGQANYTGLLMRWDGSAWSRVDHPARQRLRAIDLVSADDGWAVGDYGTILHWDGQAWSQVASPTTASLHGVDMLSATDGWIVSGYPGVFLHWDGSTWSQVGNQTYRHLYGIDMLAPTDGWAVGEGPIWHWDGLAWQTMQGTDVLYGIDMLSPTDGWAGGGYYWGEEGWETVLGHWDGSNWSLEQEWGWPLRSIAMLSPTDGWAVGGGTHTDHWGCTYAGWEFKHWDGAAWADVGNPSGRQLNSVVMLSAADGWAVGNGTILRYRDAESGYRVFLPEVLR